MFISLVNYMSLCAVLQSCFCVGRCECLYISVRACDLAALWQSMWPSARCAVPCLCWVRERKGERNAGAILGLWLEWRWWKPGLHVEVTEYKANSWAASYQFDSHDLNEDGVPYQTGPRSLALNKTLDFVCLKEQEINIPCFLTIALCLLRGQLWSEENLTPLNCITSWQINSSIPPSLFCVITKTLGAICMVICSHLQ